MKLHHCKYCKETVSPKADHCPHCGEPHPAEKGHEWIVQLLRTFGFTSIMISLFFWGCNINILNIQPFFYFVLTALGLSFLLKSIQLT